MFECVECGYQTPKYYGKCPQCQAWNSLVESGPDENQSDASAAPDAPGASVRPVLLDRLDRQEASRELTGIQEFDRVLGGGIVPHSVILIGGEPGVGKSTLLLEVADALGKKKHRILYYSGEESASQINLRADRLGIDSQQISLLSLGSLEDLKKSIQEISPDILIIDSIQTIHSRKTTRIAGSAASLRLVTAEIIELAKKKNITVFIIGQITKDGQLAGPKSLEHMVDVVLYFQGEMKTDIRILRAEKNRFGPVDEVGIFQMVEKGLTSVTDPSEIFIQHRQRSETGVSVFPLLNGLRSILIEVQSLVSESAFVGNPRRTSLGFDNYRLAMLVAVIEKKLKMPFYKSDIFLNVTGGFFIRETAADLAVCATLLSEYKGRPLRQDAVFIGELGLTGEVRPVSFLDNRLKEAVRHGFTGAFLPQAQAERKNNLNLTIYPVATIHDLYKKLMP